MTTRRRKKMNRRMTLIYWKGDRFWLGKLLEHPEIMTQGETLEEVECFFSDFSVRRNKSYGDRYQLIGRTEGGRRLKIIFQLKPGNVVRIVTGWPL
jgi:hypothetical protein